MILWRLPQSHYTGSTLLYRTCLGYPSISCCWRIAFSGLWSSVPPMSACMFLAWDRARLILASLFFKLRLEETSLKEQSLIFVMLNLFHETWNIFLHYLIQPKGCVLYWVRFRISSGLLFEQWGVSRSKADNIEVSVFGKNLQEFLQCRPRIHDVGPHHAAWKPTVTLKPLI